MTIERSPAEAPARIAPLPNLPLFHKVAGRKIVVFGASDGAHWKAELAKAAGADVVRLERWTPDDLRGAALAIADLPDRDEALRFVAAARAAGVPVNALHAEGFLSIGCEPCTRALRPGEPERAGRWWWESDEARECGLHVGADGRLTRRKEAA